MQVIISILGAVLVFGVLVVVHEFGHYASARALGIPVVEFAVGFGKKLWSKNAKGTEFSIRALPLGGYCRFVDGELAEAERLPSFRDERPWKKLIVYVSGALMNILLALVLAMVLLLAYGDYSATVQSVNDGSPAQAAGLQAGDVILAINGKQMAFDFSAMEKLQESTDATLSVLRGTERLKITVDGIYDEQAGKNMLGIMLSYNETRRPFSLTESIGASIDFLAFFVKELFAVIGSLFTSPETAGDKFAGPLGVVTIIGQAVRSGFETVLRLMVLISVNLGVFNLLPIPGLDGAHMVICLGEMITGRRLSEKAEGIVAFVGFALLMGLTLFVTYGDIVRMIS